MPPPASWVRHDYADALKKSLLFYRAQRSGDLSAAGFNPIPWRRAPSFLTDGADVGVDLSGGYFDAGDFIKFGQPAAFTMSILAWSGLVFAESLQRAGALEELKRAVRWGTDYMLQAARHVDRACTYYAQVGRGAADGCRHDACKYDHGYWGRPEDYHARYAFAWQRRTYWVNSSRPGIEIWASASAALAAAHLLFRQDDHAYSSTLLRTSRKLFECAADGNHNPENAFLQAAGLPEVAPQYASFGFSDELGWASAWLYDATRSPAYLLTYEVQAACDPEPGPDPDGA